MILFSTIGQLSNFGRISVEETFYENGLLNRNHLLKLSLAFLDQSAISHSNFHITVSNYMCISNLKAIGDKDNGCLVGETSLLGVWFTNE